MEAESLTETDGNKKEKRKRQKQLFKDVKKQMEFYFSDANMRKDRFLRQQVDATTDGYVDLSVFGNFNKLRVLTTDMSLVAKALSKKSDFLQVSEDGKKVKRIPPIPEDNPCDVDERTVYVESLPPNADHDSLKQMFSACGEVSYVSLPRYQSTKDIKGFAFIEYSTAEAAQKACQMLNKPPANADKAGKFPRGSKDYARLQRQLSIYNKHGHRKQKKRHSLGSVNSDQSTDERCERQRTLSDGQSSDTSSQTAPKRKGKRKTSGSLSDSDIPVKLRRKSSGDASVKSELSTGDGKENDDKEPLEKEPLEKDEGRLESKEEDEEDTSKRAKRKRKHSEEETTQEQVGVEEVPAKLKKKVRISEDVGQAKPEGGTTMLETEQEKKKKKKRKGKKKSKELKEAAAALPELRVIPKTEWAQLKREYLQQQKANMASFKLSLTQLKQTSQQHKREQQMSQQYEREQQMAQQYEREQQMEDAQPQKKEETKKKEIEYVPGVIIKFTSTQMQTRKDIKAKLQDHADIAYYDILDGQSEGHIRCADADSATRLAKNSFEGLVFSQLTDEAESTYWEKIKSDRHCKMSTKPKGKKRGSKKIADKAEKTSTKAKHIIFEDD